MKTEKWKEGTYMKKDGQVVRILEHRENGYCLWIDEKTGETDGWDCHISGSPNDSRGNTNIEWIESSPIIYYEIY